VIEAAFRNQGPLYVSSAGTNEPALSIAVWGSAGGGKTLLAINLAFELARLSKKVLLVDLDVRRPSISSWLGLTEAGPGITAALRLAKAGRLSLEELQRLCAELRFSGSQLDILPGLSNPKRWREMSPELLSTLFDLSVENFDFVVFDLNDEFDSAERLASSDQFREEATTWAIARADLVLAPFVADLVGINRFLFDRQRAEFEFWPIANRASSRSQGFSSAKKFREELEPLLSVPLRAILPSDAGACESSIANARPLMLQSPNSKLTLAIRSLAGEIADYGRQR
jgi:MinD-like ATPase involved in chromosome partitioning or flagellar assembly